MIAPRPVRDEHVGAGSEVDAGQGSPADQKRQSGTAITGDTHDEDAAADNTLSENADRFRTGQGSATGQ